jgi:hypothetical protein
MALENTDTQRNRRPLYLGFAAVALVVVLGIVAVNGRDDAGMDTGAPAQGIGNETGTVDGGTTNAPVVDGNTAPVDPVAPALDSAPEPVPARQPAPESAPELAPEPAPAQN